MKDFKRYLNESRSRKLNEASSMKFGEKGWKSVIESTKPKDYKNVRKAHSFRCGMDSTKIKKCVCRY